MGIIKRLGVFPNTGKENVLSALPDFLDMCRSHGLNPLLPIDLAKDYGCDAFDVEQPATLLSLDVAVSLGGDGTLLQMSRHLLTYDIPLFGINFGTLGFLAEVEVQSMHKAITRLSQGNYSIEKRSLLRAQVIHEETGVVVATAHALNEFVLAKGIYSKMGHMQMFLNGKPSGRYAADGLIIATATGSTAYNLSAGGPLVMPELDVSVITPICAHSLQSRAFVVPMTDLIELRCVPGSEECLLAGDGENIAPVLEGDVVRIEHSPYQINLIRLTSRDYYQTWYQKLMRPQ